MKQNIMQVSGLTRWQIPVVFMFILILWGGGPASRAAAQGGEPVMVISSPNYGAGTIWEGETLSHAFEVRNEGNAELKIFHVAPG
jgi:hypothetical protein